MYMYTAIQNTGARLQQDYNGPATNTAASFLCLGFIIVLGSKILSDAAACQTWNSDIFELKHNVYQAYQDASSAEKIYRERARFNCALGFHQGTPSTLKNPESMIFCGNYSKNLIPSFWGVNASFCDTLEFKDQLDIPGTKLTCYANQAIKTQNYYEQIKTKLAKKVAQKPLFCKAQNLKSSKN